MTPGETFATVNRKIWQKLKFNKLANYYIPNS